MSVSSLARLTETLAKLERTTAVLDRYAQDMDRAHVPIEASQQVARSVLDELRPLIRSMVLANYAAAGIHDKTNKLRNAIGACIVGGSFNAGNLWKLWVLLPRGIAPYVYTPHPLPGHKAGKQTSSNFYKVAMTLTYGGVIPVKKGDINTLSRRSRANTKERMLTTGKNAKRGGVAYRVMTPKYAFYLSPGQKAEISSIFTEKYTTKMRNLFRG